MSNNIQEIKDLPFNVSGKTGTTSSQKDNGEIVNHSLYIAYAPTQKSQIVISVVIPGRGFAAKSAALIAANILKT
ncbi:Penicillin binding protein transpeptidase domain-containing protein [Bacillus sp. ok061]|nr:Penicillin binding protein transpeptidase domain-containing protein [Bacillus sp. ok061]